MGKRSKNYIGLINARKEDKLSKIFLENKSELMPIYLAGFVDGCCTISISARYKKNKFAIFTPCLHFINRSVSLSKFLCKKYQYNYNCYKQQFITINGIKAFYFIKEIFPYLLRNRLFAKYILLFGFEKGLDKYYMLEKSMSYRKEITVDRAERDALITISIRSKNKNKSGNKSRDLKRLINYYKSNFKDKIELVDLIDNNKKYIPDIFTEREEGKKFTERQLVYIAGYFDSKRSFSFRNNIPEIKLYKKGNKKISEFIKIKYEKNSIWVLDGYKAIDLTKQVYDFLITNKDKASYLLDWYNNIGNEKKQYEIIYKSLINYPYEQGNHSKSLKILKERYKNRFGIELT